MTDAQWTSPERPIIWSPGRPATGSRGRPCLDLLNICFSSKKQVCNRNRCVKQGLLHLKNNSFIKSSIFVLVPGESFECPLEVPDVRTFRGPSGDVPGTSRAGWEEACSKLRFSQFKKFVSRSALGELQLMQISLNFQTSC